MFLNLLVKGSCGDIYSCELFRCNTCNSYSEFWVYCDKEEYIWKLLGEIITRYGAVILVGTLKGNVYTIPDFLLKLKNNRLDELRYSIKLHGNYYIECGDFCLKNLKNWLDYLIFFKWSKNSPQQAFIKVKEIDALDLLKYGIRILRPLNIPLNLCKLYKGLEKIRG